MVTQINFVLQECQYHNYILIELLLDQNDTFLSLRLLVSNCKEGCVGGEWRSGWGVAVYYYVFL